MKLTTQSNAALAEKLKLTLDGMSIRTFVATLTPEGGKHITIAGVELELESPSKASEAADYNVNLETGTIALASSVSVAQAKTAKSPAKTGQTCNIMPNEREGASRESFGRRGKGNTKW